MYTYDIEWTVNDDGAQNRSLILHLPQKVKMADVKEDAFSVYVERKNKQGEIMCVKPRWDSPDAVPSKGYRTVLKAYPSDEKGNPMLEGTYVTLELDMMDDQSRALVGTLMGNRFVDSFYRVTQTAPVGDVTGMVFDTLGQVSCPEADRYTSKVSSYAPLPLSYSYFTPPQADQEPGGKWPCIIWLHGAGEGGEDPRVSYLGNRVTALSSDPIQAFMGGAWVLVPTCPTMWMDDGEHENYLDDSVGKSKYSEALFALIEEFAKGHAVDMDRIYIGGCSNGGFMTMRQIIDHPDYFAAGFPMCEALYDRNITEEEIRRIKDVPIWFLHAMTDEVVDPEATSVPTYHRLIRAGAKNVHFTYIDDKPPLHRMVNHGCWPLGLNNEHNYDFHGEDVLADGRPVTRFEWLAAMRNDRR